MYNYNLEQWLVFFYIYCFLGWVWESCYVSAKKKKWINRGFIHGPLLPLYGSGAIVVLFLTIPVRYNNILVFLFGMIGATVLEYFTGAIMEKLFHVRYWDYSKVPFNLNGHICLIASLAWGVFSLLMIHVFHRPIEALVFMLPMWAIDASAFVLTVIFVVDFTQSFNEAMDLREMLTKLTNSSEELRRLEKRVDVVTAVIGDDIKQAQQKMAEGKLALEEKINIQRLIPEYFKDRRYARSLRMLKRNPDSMSKEFADVLIQIKDAGLKRIRRQKTDQTSEQKSDHKSECESEQ